MPCALYMPPLESETAAEIHRAFLENSVVAFRDQDLSPERQIAFTEIFGKVEQHPLYRSNLIEGFPAILVLEHKAGQYINGKNDIWHADITFKEEPPLGSMLHCKAAWEGFADTMFASQKQAFHAPTEVAATMRTFPSAPRRSRNPCTAASDPAW